MQSLYEKHRPKTLNNVIGQGKAVKIIGRLVASGGAGGRCFWISGASGTGKTTLARIISNSIADDVYVQEYDSADQLSAAALDKIDADMYYRAFGKGGKAVIINEAHGLRKSAIRRLLGILERIPDYVVFVFTTTREGESDLFDDNIDASPLLSRCIKVELTNQGLSKVFAEHCRAIATAENLNGKPIESYIRLAAKSHNNCRQMFQEIEAGNLL